MTTAKRISDINNVFLEMHSTSTAQAAKQFNDTINSLNGITDSSVRYDPNDVDVKLTSYMERFDRLKFLYLEQEAKEKFLRTVLQSSSNEITQEDIRHVDETNDVLKEELQEKSHNVDLLMGLVEKSVAENEHKRRKITNFGEKVIEKITKLESIQQKIGLLQKEISEKENRDPLFNKLEEIHEINEKVFEKYSLGESFTSTNDIEETIKKSDHRNSKLESEVAQLRSVKEQMLKSIAEQQDVLSTRNKEINNLNKMIELLQPVSKDETTIKKLEAQEFRINLLITIWKRWFDFREFEYDHDKDVIKFKFENQKEKLCLINLRDKSSLTILSLEYPNVPKITLQRIVNLANSGDANDETPVSIAIFKLRQLITNK